MSMPDVAALSTRVTELLGVRYPIVQAPMGWIARAQLASAVSNAGGLGIIETSSGELDAVRGEIEKMRDLTDRPFGVNIAQLFVRDPAIVDFVVEQNASQALRLAERAYVLETGRVVKEGSGDQLLHDQSVIAAYLGG